MSSRLATDPRLDYALSHEGANCAIQSSRHHRWGVGHLAGRHRRLYGKQGRKPQPAKTTAWDCSIYAGGIGSNAGLSGRIV
jgi:hypothetical protein